MNYILIILALTSCVGKIDAINRSVNKNPYIAGVYNCKNYAEDKYWELLKAGYTNNDIRFVITDYHKQQHVVLKVKNYLLDNNSDYLKPVWKQEGVEPEYWFKVRKIMEAKNG